MVRWHNSYRVGPVIPIVLPCWALLCNNCMQVVHSFCLCGQPVWFGTSYGRESVCWIKTTHECRRVPLLSSDWQVNQASFAASGSVTAYCCSAEQTMLANKPHKQPGWTSSNVQCISAVTQLFIKQIFIITKYKSNESWIHYANIIISWMVDVNIQGVCRHVVLSITNLVGSKTYYR